MTRSLHVANHRLSTLLAIFLVALAVRLLYLWDGLDNPSFYAPIVDAGSYDEVARQLAATGDLAPRLFWQPFLYPVFLAAVYLATDGSILAAKLLQAVLGAATCCLVFLLGARLFDRRTALLAAGFTVFYGPLILFEAELLAAGWAAFQGVLLVLLFGIAGERHRPGVCLALGAVGALAVLTRPTILPFLAAAWLWLLVRSHRRLGTRPAAVALALGLAGFLPLVAPVALLGQRVTGRFGFLPGSGGLNAYIGNNPDSCATLTVRPGDEWGELVDLPARSGHTSFAARNRFFYRQVADFALREPARFVGGLGAKALRLASSRELPRNFDPYLFREWSTLQSLLTWKAGGWGFPFGLLLPLAAIGLLRHRRRLGAPVLLYLVAYPLAVVAIFVASRYRVPLIPVLAVPAAAGLWSLADDLVARRWRRTAGAAGAIGVITLLATLPGPFCEETGHLDADFFYCLAFAQSERGDPDGAVASYTRALDLQPDLPAVHYNLAGIFLGRDELEAAAGHLAATLRLRPDHARAHNNLGLVRERQGDVAAAEGLYAAAAELDPDLALAHRNLGNTRLQLRRPAEAIPPLERALELEPDHPNTHFFLGSAYLQTARVEQALDHLRRAVALERNPRFHNELGTALIAARRFGEAVEQFRLAIELAPDYLDAYNNAGAALVMSGDTAAALEHFQDTVNRWPDYADARYNLAALLLRLGRRDAAETELSKVLVLRPDHPQAGALLRRIRAP